jgi:hypothetical protein
LKTIILLSLLTLSSFCHSINIEGTWKSDAKLTMKFNDSHAKLTKIQRLLLSELMGNLIISYKGSTLTSTMPKTTVTTKGKPTDFEGFAEIEKYKIIGETTDTLVLEITSQTGEKNYSILRFENENLYWVYVPHSSNIINVHIREYFVRQK